MVQNFKEKNQKEKKIWYNFGGSDTRNSSGIKTFLIVVFM